MKSRAKAAPILLLIAAAIAVGQSATDDRAVARETQTRGYWIDQSTGLVWAGKDNGEDVSPRKAKSYCQNLSLAGYSDWRLPTLAELVSIYDKGQESLGENPRSRWHEAEPMTYHVKGSLFLTGREWSSNRDGYPRRRMRVRSHKPRAITSQPQSRHHGTASAE